MKENLAHRVSSLIAFSPVVNESLSKQVEQVIESHKHGGISYDGTYAWLYHGSYLEIVSTRNGTRLAAWCFGVVLKDTSTTICCCKELVHNSISRLIVSTNSILGDMLVLFDVSSSTVVKAIQMPYKVTSIEVINSSRHVLTEYLQCFCGIIAVGTHCGHLYLIDMNLDDCGYSNEMQPSTLGYIDMYCQNIASLRHGAVNSKSHLCLQLAEDACKRGSYFYKKPDDEVIKCFPADEVFISCLHWVPQTGQLVVGFSFGSFQLWRLSIPVLEYTGRYEDDAGPVSHISYTEPENDPRNFCYLWISRGPLPSDHQVDYNSCIVLYQLGFNKRTRHEIYGYQFEDLTSVGSRFEQELSTDPFNKTDLCGHGSRLVSCYTLQDSVYTPSRHCTAEESFEEGCMGPDLSLTVFVWEAGYCDSKPASYLSLFDMNRWYHAQMPYCVRPLNSGRDVCSYLVFYGLSEVMTTCNPAGLLDVYVPYKSLSRFNSQQMPAPEQHFYPSALAFDVCFLAENGMILSNYLGQQRQLLSDLQKLGPVAVLDPTESYVRATLAGLLPRVLDNNALISQLHKREALLSLAVNYELTMFINNCVSQFASADFVLRGCTIRFILEWVWKFISSVKENIDVLCVPLYDWSGILLDKQSLKMLHQHSSNLNQLVHLLHYLSSQSATGLGHQDVEVKYNVAILLRQHLQMVLWFHSVGLLPENSDEEKLSDAQYAYPRNLLENMYTQRRLDLTRLHRTLKSGDVLHVDSFVERQGQQMVKLFSKDGGNGLYPFNSFHDLLKMYLLDEVSHSAKLSLTFYMLCDLFSLLPEEQQQQFNDKLQHFAQAFSFSVSMQKFVQGIWLLDHKEFKDALTYLLDPCLSHYIEPWQHAVIVKAYLYQGHHQLALKYLRVRKPVLSTQHDVKLTLTTLLANGLTSEAFEFQRQCRDELNADDLLSHLFVGSVQTKTVDQLLQLPFTEDEERHLLKYLQSNRDHHSNQLLIVYFLQRSRFVEAIRLNSNMEDEADSEEKDRVSARKSIINSYHMLLPQAQRKLALSADSKRVDKRLKTRKKFNRPKPLSTTVNKSQRNHVITRATLLQAVFEKTHEIKPEAEAESEEAVEEMQVNEEADIEETGPFVCTPITQRLRKRISDCREVVFASSKTPICALSPVHSPTASVRSPMNIRFTTLSSRKKVLTASDLTMLQMPPVKRKTPPFKRPLLLKADTPKTPQSILKVRHNPLRRSPSPVVFPRKTKTEISLPTPPRLTRLATSLVTAAATESSNTPGTPTKHLRFSVPSRRGTLTPELRDTLELRDTPTPELRDTPPPELRDTSTPELRDTSTPELRDTPTPELRDTPTPELRDMPTPGLECMKAASDLPEVMDKVEDLVEESDAREATAKSVVSHDLDLSPGSADLTPSPRPPIREKLRLTQHSPTVKDILDSRTTPQKQSPKTLAVPVFCPDISDSSKYIEVDSEITFNFTQNINNPDVNKDKMAESSTSAEPVSGRSDQPIVISSVSSEERDQSQAFSHSVHSLVRSHVQMDTKPTTRRVLRREETQTIVICSSSESDVQEREAIDVDSDDAQGNVFEESITRYHINPNAIVQGEQTELYKKAEHIDGYRDDQDDTAQNKNLAAEAFQMVSAKSNQTKQSTEFGTLNSAVQMYNAGDYTGNNANKMDECENLHLELEDYDELLENQEGTDNEERHERNIVQTEYEFINKDELPGVQNSMEEIQGGEFKSNASKSYECTKEPADSSNEKAASDIKKTPRKSPARSRTAQNGDRSTQQGGLDDSVLLESPSRRRSMRIAMKTPPRKSMSDNYKLDMPPTPPKSSSPASTASSVELQCKPLTPVKHKRGRKTLARVAVKTPPTTAASALSPIRSRSSSPVVVTSTTEEMSADVSVSETCHDKSIQVQELDSPLCSAAFVMTMHSGEKAVGKEEEHSPVGSTASNLGEHDEEFTFSMPTEIPSQEEVFDTQPAAAFVFSPPLTRLRRHRMSLTPSTAPSSTINLLPQVPEHTQTDLSSRVLQSPAKRKKKQRPRSDFECTPSDSPINFLPEPDPSELPKQKSRGMTLRTRGPLPKANKKRIKKHVL